MATLFGLRGKDPNSLVVPPAPNVDTTKAQADAIAGNTSNLPALDSLASLTNDATARQFLAMMEKLIPGFADISKTIAGNIQSQVHGELPPDVEAYIGRKSAERGISRGTAGSEFNKYGELRDLGLTSLEMTDRGLSSAQRWLSSQPAPMSFQSMFVSPAQRIATEQWNEVNRYNTQFLRNQISMLPSNEDMAYAQMLDYVADFATMAAGVGVGSIGGGGAAGGAGGGAGGYQAAAQNAAMNRPMAGYEQLYAPQQFNPPPPQYTPAPLPYQAPPYQQPNTPMQPGGWGAP